PSQAPSFIPRVRPLRAPGRSLVTGVPLSQRLERRRDLALVTAVLGRAQASDQLLAALARRALGPPVEPLVGGAAPVGMPFACAEPAQHALGHRAGQLGEELCRLEVLVASTALENALPEGLELLVLELGEHGFALDPRRDVRVAEQQLDELG